MSASEWLLRWSAAALCVATAGAAQQAPIPAPNGLPGRPYAIKRTWVIGGLGNWDTLTLDASAGLLYIAHQLLIQVVDINTGNVTATVGGFREAHAIALDASGNLAYATDGQADGVRIFDRRTFKVVGSVRTGPNPRALVLDPATNLLFVICSSESSSQANQGSNTAARTRPNRTAEPPAPPARLSTITVIDPDRQVALANLWIEGRLGVAQADGAGQIYVAVEDRNEVARLDSSAIAQAIRNSPAAEGQSSGGDPLVLDLRKTEDAADVGPRFIPLGRDCSQPRALAIDQPDARMFVACDNQKLLVMDAGRGGVLTEFTIGPGAGAMAWDAARGLIYTSNGGGYGSLSIIRRDLTDSYAEVQNLPTLQQARTLALNPATGEVYLVTTLYGANLRNPPAYGPGTLKLKPVDGSFQVMVVGN